MCGSFAGTFSSRERMHTTGDERLGVGAGSSLHHYAVAGLEDEPSEVDRVARALLGPFRRKTSTNGDRYRPYGHSKWRTQVSILARSAGVASSTFQVATSAADNTHSETPVVLPPASADSFGDSVRDEPALAALVERAARRDQAAFAALYDLFLGPMYRYVYYRVGNRADAEDIAEQVFLQAWAAIDRFRWQGKPFVAWLYTLAHNLVVDWRRRSHPTQSLDNDEHPIDLRSTTAERALSQSLDADLLAPAIRRLTPEQQQVITLKFVAGLDTAQVATVMNKREGTIRALQLRALQRLRRDLERQGEQGSA